MRLLCDQHIIRRFEFVDCYWFQAIAKEKSEMKFRSLGLAAGLGVLAGGAALASAAGVPVTIDCSSIHAIQTYNVGESATDDAYLLVTGYADGKAVNLRFPDTGTWKAAPKASPVADKKPLQLWKGDLEDGHFAVLTVTLMQGKGSPQDKELLAKLDAAEKSVDALSKPSIGSADDLKKLAAEKLKADKSVISKIKDMYSRDKNTDHYGGQFTLIVWNNRGKLTKRLDPVGLTFGEDNGLDIKIYSKLKNTRNNVISKNEKGQWEELQYEPTNDDANEIRVKELETEYIPQAKDNPVRHVTDYLVGIQVLGGDGKALVWTVEDEQNKLDAIHVFWNYAD